MPLHERLIMTFILIFSCSNLRAQAMPDACAVLPNVSVPEEDRPTLDDVRATEITEPSPPDQSQSIPPRVRTFCDGESLYYSKDSRHFTKARACVLGKLGLFRAGTSPTDAATAQSVVTGGATQPADIDREGLVLVMVYASGEGVRRNLQLARRFLCEYGPGIESDTGSEQLIKFDALLRDGKHFDMCGDGIAFGRGVAFDCLGMEQGRREDEVRRLENVVLASASSAARASFLQLRSAWRDFHFAYSSMDSAICDGGTGCGPITEQDDLQFTASWLAALKKIRAGIPPALNAKPADQEKLDKNLNEHYRASRDEFKDCVAPTNCVVPTMRAADRAWLAYREAWVRFGAVRWPALPADQWRAWQTAEWSPMVTP
jgi:hypothetical protein